MRESNGNARHILSLSGGKDSTALAIYMRERVPEMEYVFCDTGEELPETYEYIKRLEVFLGKKINWLNPDRPFKHWLQIYNGVLPDPRTRWCTRKLKIEPFEEFVGEDLCFSYVGIRADEPHRKGYISTKPNIIPRYPFVENGIRKQDVYKILEESGMGIPDYYQWRSRSGCYFCFFQQKIEWLGLSEEHPDAFEKAKEFEKFNPETGERYTWVAGETLDELMLPERKRAIIEENERRRKRLEQQHKSHQTLLNVFNLGSEEDLDEESSCLICHL